MYSILMYYRPTFVCSIMAPKIHTPLLKADVGRKLEAFQYHSRLRISDGRSRSGQVLCVAILQRSNKPAKQWSFRGGTRGNAVPIVKIPLERMGTAFPLLSYLENAWERCCIVTKLPNTVPLGHKHITIYFLKCILLS